MNVGIADIVDHVGEQPNELTPEACFFGVRQQVDTYRSIGVAQRQAKLKRVLDVNFDGVACDGAHPSQP